jgi:alkylation response protein AidB-like acyl-CoA dehydrogenase
MDLADSPEEATFRTTAREWLSWALPQLSWPEPADLAARAPFWRQWQRMAFDAGYAGLSWPKEYGGAGADAKLRAIFAEEADRAGAPERLNTIGEDFAGPTIIDFGTAGQKTRFLRPILTGEQIWCQLFSEPEAGSDLASLRTQASRADGGWRIQGQKIWTSRAHLASHAILLARTGGGPRHKGITYFILPMGSPGVTVRPLAHMLGEAEFNEVFLDDVFVPDDLVVGDVDDGRPLGTDPVIRQKVADLYGRALIHYLIGQRVATQAADGRQLGPVGSIGKLFFCPLVEDLADFRLSLAPLGGQFAPADDGADDGADDDARWLRLAYQARGTAIAGGSTFIQRNIVAERILKLPRS